MHVSSTVVLFLPKTVFCQGHSVSYPLLQSQPTDVHKQTVLFHWLSFYLETIFLEFLNSQQTFLNLTQCAVTVLYHA